MRSRGKRGRTFALLVVGAALLVGLCAQTAFAATPEPTPVWVNKGTSNGVVAYAYATCWKRGVISPYTYIGGATGVKASKAVYRMTTQCTVQKMNLSTGAWYDAWVYSAKTGSNTAGPVRFATPDPGGPYVSGTYRVRTKNTGNIWVASPVPPLYFTQYSGTVPY